MTRTKELEKLIQYHKALYYQGRPEIPDHEYDGLEEELQNIDPNNSVLSIVGSITKNLKKIAHNKKMLSLDKTYSTIDLKKWLEKNQSISMFKLDGVSCSAIYKDGQLSLAKTRGDGSFGEDITEKVKWLENFPKNIKAKGEIEIRGELYCNEEAFFNLSEEMTKIGLDKPSSQRNIVAGLMGRKENIELCRYLSFQAFDAIGDDLKVKKETEKFELLRKWKFDIPKVVLHEDTSKVDSVIDEAEHFMSEGEYQIDGIVFSINDLQLHEELGETAHHPRYKIAFKFKGESKETTLIDIIWSISRNGILTPVGNIDPIDLSGAMISRVTLHNYGMVKQNNLKSGDKIEIIRSGEVIPKFLSVVKSSNKDFKIPKKCPSCDSKVDIVDIRLYCSNEECPGRNKEQILNFVQKIGIESISNKRLEEMIKDGLVTDIPSLYKLKKDEFLNLEKVKEKLATKFSDEIEKSKNASLTTFLGSLGISGGAFNKCEKIINSGYNTIDKVLSLTEEQLQGVESFAEKSAKDFLASLKSKEKMINELVKLGFSFKNEKVTHDSLISGKKICITGALSVKRSEVEQKVRSAGGVVVSSVSKNTDILLTNETDSKSSKFKKAKDLNIEIISEADLENLI